MVAQPAVAAGDDATSLRVGAQPTCHQAPLPAHPFLVKEDSSAYSLVVAEDNGETGPDGPSLMPKDFQTFAVVEMWDKVSFVDGYNRTVVMGSEAVAVNKNLGVAVDYLLVDETVNRLAPVVLAGYKYQDNCAHLSLVQSMVTPNLLTQKLGGRQRPS